MSISTHEELLMQLPTDWAVRQLSQISDRIESGGTPSREIPRYWGGNIAWLTPGELTGHTEKYVIHTRDHITDLGLRSSGATEIPTNSLMVTTRATLGSKALAGSRMTTNQGFKSVVFAEAVDPSFYYHLFDLLKPELKRRASGTTFLEVSGNEFGQIRVPLPPFDEQQKIAEILDSVDESLRTTERLIAKLTNRNRALLQELFTKGIDLQGRVRADYSNDPSQYVISEHGKVPATWQVRPLDEVATRGSGHTPNKQVPSYWNGGIKWVSLADSSKLDQIYIRETDKEISHLGLANSSAVLHPAGTVILSRDAGVGKSAILAKEMAVSQHFMAWQCGKLIDHHYLYYWLQYRKHIFESIALGSTIKTIGLPYFKRLRIALPEIREQRLAANILLNSEQSVLQEWSNLEKLRTLKRGLMDDLLTGRVRVNAGEGVAS